MGWFDCREEAKKKTDAVLGVSQPETAHPDLSYQKQFFLYQGEAERGPSKLLGDRDRDCRCHVQGRSHRRRGGCSCWHGFRGLTTPNVSAESGTNNGSHDGYHILSQ